MSEAKPRVIEELHDLIDQATKERSHYYVKAVCEKAVLAIGALADENKRLKKIIAKELSENDELGSEFTYVTILKEENRRLREALEKISERVENDPIGETRVRLEIYKLVNDALGQFREWRGEK